MPIRPSGNLIIGGQTFHIDAPIVNWHDNGWDATSEMCMPTQTSRAPACTTIAPGKHVPYGNLPTPYTRRYSTRPALRTSKWKNGEAAPYEAVKSVIKSFVIHHDGCATADMCFTVLQNERGLSCHFLVDNDGTIFQTIDLGLMAYHASEWNTASIGVELCNRGDAKKEPTYYSRKGVNRPITPCKINNHTILSYDYTEAQYRSMEQLGRALLRLLPNLPADYPQSSPGVQTWDTMPYPATFGFSGYIAHYHLTNQKWDPGPFDFKKFCGKLRGSFCFPMFPRGAPDKDQIQPTVPQQTSAIRDDAKLLYAMNEQKAEGGFFPVGPWGEHRLWHGGIHLAGRDGAPVFATFPARLVAARMGANGTQMGSVNFALLRHQMTLGNRKVEFYTLYMHLADELSADKPVEWLAKARRDKDGKPRELKAGAVMLLDEPIEAGSQIGRVGKAGPGDLARGQIHFEVFSQSDLFEGWPSNPWRVVDGSSSGRLSDAAEVNDQIDGNSGKKDGMLSRDELRAYFGTGSGAGMHHFVVRHVSEWTHEPSWLETVKIAKDFRTLKPDEIEEFLATRITPGLWWTDEVAAHCRLPSDGVVYHYHPIKFVSWFNEQLADAAAAAGGSTIDLADAKEVPAGITDDFGDKDGTSMRSANEFVEDTCNSKLTLKELVLGYDAPECGP